jgi:Protein of unknown function (DUF1566)
MRFWRIIAAIICFCGEVAYAGPYFSSKDGLMVLDKATGLIWMRCSLGQKWDGEACSGVPTDFRLELGRALANSLNAGSLIIDGKTDPAWVVPKIHQIASLRACSEGGLLGVVNVGAQEIEKECPDFSYAPTIDAKIFPNTKADLYLSSSIDGEYSWLVGFNSGNVVNYRGGVHVFIRLVRSVSMTEEDLQDFPYEELKKWFAAEKMRNKIQREAEEIKKEEERKRVAAEERRREMDERLRAEDRRKKEAEEAATERAILQEAIAKGAQQLYLLAGQAQRGKEIKIHNRVFSATKIYEIIIDNFPKSEFAVKADDQLNAIKRDERMERERQARAANEANERRDAQSREYDPCAHLYVGKVVSLKGAFGITFDGEVRGTGGGKASVRSFHPIRKEWSTDEFLCSNLR